MENLEQKNEALIGGSELNAGLGVWDPDTIAEHLRGMLADGTTQCPLCGETWVHTHSLREIVIYRNGIKYGRSIA